VFLVYSGGITFPFKNLVLKVHHRLSLMKRSFYSYLVVLLLFTASCVRDSTKTNTAETQSATSYQADLIIYGGTSAAITAAVQAVKMGKSVLVVSPDKHLGGLSSGGLGFTDTGQKEVIGGLAREFYHRLYLHYQNDSAWQWQKKRNTAIRDRVHLP
jgi:hypothetical protein